ncbi:MAG: hypothetical protein GF346_11935 [Candidatus Eisenbacteria bacterium]|nr:hypothetical protein [Candidatus Latescibacterota bacterium]MBD3303146.1 hypothetical protein [Candidatus Eisenbacteria bacterium]
MPHTKDHSRARMGAYSAVVLLLVALVLIAANFIASRVLARVDLTADKEFTISEATKDVLRGLDDLVTIKVYFTKRLPPHLATLRRDIDDILREYEAYARGNLRVEYIDPSENPEEEQKLRFLGIPQIQLNVLEKDQLQVINGYMGIAILYADRHSTIPIVQAAYTLEYDLTAGILQVLASEKRVVGYLTGHQEPELARDFDAMSQLLGETYEVRPVDLNGGREAVPEEINTLVIARPQAVPERDQWQIDQYLMRGGRLLFLIDPIRMDEEMGLQQPLPVSSNLDDLLAHYGVRPKRALVQDMRNELAGFTQGYVRYTVPYPLWPKLMGEGLSQEHPITNRLESVVLPWTGPLELLIPESGTEPDSALLAEGTSQPDVEATVLGRSSDRAWLQQGRFELTPPGPFQREQTQAPEETQSYPLAVALVGSFHSYFEGKEVPPVPGDTLAASPEPETLTRSPETQVIVLANSRFAASDFLAMFPGNQEFLLNTVDWMTLGEELIAIRSRGATERPLQIESATGKTLFKYGHTFGMAALVAIFGVVRFSVRRSRKKTAAAEAGA